MCGGGGKPVTTILSSEEGGDVTAAGSCEVPGGGGWLGGLPLDLRLLAELLPQGGLHLGGDVRRRLADLHGRLQELHSAPPVHLHLQRVLLLHLSHFALGDRRRCSRRHVGESHVEAIFDMGWQSLAPPNGPAQLPKDKERDYQQGEATETHDHSKETNRDVYMSPIEEDRDT